MIEQSETLKDLLAVLNSIKKSKKDGDIRTYALAHGYLVRINRLINSIENKNLIHHENIGLLIEKTKQFIGQQ